MGVLTGTRTPFALAPGTGTLYPPPIPGVPPAYPPRYGAFRSVALRARGLTKANPPRVLVAGRLKDYYAAGAKERQREGGREKVPANLPEAGESREHAARDNGQTPRKTGHPSRARPRQRGNAGNSNGSRSQARGLSVQSCQRLYTPRSTRVHRALASADTICYNVSMKRKPRPEAARTRTIAYVRVSTEKQADHGVSLEAQRAKVEAYAALYDLDLVAVEIDAGVSAKSLDRPALARALAELAAGRADALLVVKLDRLTRSVRDLGDLVELCTDEGWALLSVSDQIDTRTAAGRLVLNVLASVAQWEREAVGERTKAALDFKRACGKIAGTVPYGSRLAADGVHLEADPAEAAAVAMVRELRAEGVSIRRIAERLNLEGMPCRGGRWHPTTVVRIAAVAA